jgi:hypothetical protein
MNYIVIVSIILLTVTYFAISYTSKNNGQITTINNDTIIIEDDDIFVDSYGRDYYYPRGTYWRRHGRHYNYNTTINKPSSGGGTAGTTGDSISQIPTSYDITKQFKQQLPYNAYRTISRKEGFENLLDHDDCKYGKTIDY